MLSSLWEMDEEEVEHVAGAMEEISVCSVECRALEGVQVMGIRAHDLAHDYCTMQARDEDPEGAKWWHRKVVEGYRSRYLEGEQSGEDAKWWSEQVANDSYANGNLARHLVDSGMAEELERLVLDYQWTMRKLKVNRYLGLESDFNELLRWKKQGEAVRARKRDSTATGRHIQSRDEAADDLPNLGNGDEIKLIVKTVRMCLSRASMKSVGFDFRQLSFQLLGRLVNVEDEMIGVMR